MGHKKEKYLKKQFDQRVNSQENERYYQNGSEPKNPRSDAKRRENRTLA